MGKIVKSSSFYRAHGKRNEIWGHDIVEKEIEIVGKIECVEFKERWNHHVLKMIHMMWEMAMKFSF